MTGGRSRTLARPAPVPGATGRAAGPSTILYATPSGTLGGVERFLEGVFANHDPARVRPVLLTASDGPWVTAMRTRGHAAYVLEDARLRNLPAITRRVAGILRAERVALVHSAYAWTHALLSPACRLAGVPQVWFEHGPVWPGWWRGITSLLPARALLVNSRWTLEAVSRTAHVAGARVVVPLTVDSDRMRPDAAARARFRAAWGVADDEPCIGIVGFIDPYKGQHIFLDAAERMLDAGGRARFFIVGGVRRDAALAYCAPYEAELRARVAARGLEAVVHFTGHLDVEAGPLDGLDVVVNASIHAEPFGMVVIEAMSKGRPVIAPAEGGPLETIAHEVDGLLVPRRDPAALADAMQRLASDAALRARMGAAGRVKAETQYHPRVAAGRLEDVYEDVLAGRRPRAAA